MPKKAKKTLEQRVKELEEWVGDWLHSELPSRQEVMELRGDTQNLGNRLCKLEGAVAEVMEMMVPEDPLDRIVEARSGIWHVRRDSPKGEATNTKLQECLQALTKAVTTLDAGIRRFFRGDVVVTGDPPPLHTALEELQGFNIDGNARTHIAQQLPTAEELARKFHELYEAAASDWKWKTQKSCRVPFDDLPLANRYAMLQTCERLLAWLRKRGVR